MKNWVNNIVVQGLSMLSVPSIFVACAAYIPNPIFIGVAILCAIACAIFFLHKKKTVGITLLIISLVSIGLMVVNITTTEKKAEAITAQKENNIIRSLISTDTAGWRLYEERNPDMLAFIAGVLLCEVNNSDFEKRIAYIDIADKLLKESANGQSPFAYYFLAYKYHFGIGTKQYEQLAIDNIWTSLRIKETNDAYRLLEEMNVDSARYPKEHAMVVEWRKQFDDEQKEANAAMASFRPTQVDDIREWVGFHYMDSLYRGDTNALCWKRVDKYKNRLQNTAWYPFLACYYYGKDKIDSAQHFYDLSFENRSVGYNALLRGEFHKEYSLGYRGDIMPILKYSSNYMLSHLDMVVYIGKDTFPYLSMAIYDALWLKNKDNKEAQHMLKVNKDYRAIAIANERPSITEKHHMDTITEKHHMDNFIVARGIDFSQTRCDGLRMED